ncbi:MAG: hypothetical protein V2A62_02875 [Candidatus Woesearchaeota archaeon]
MTTKTGWKVLALMILAIFTISVIPLAWAEEGDVNTPKGEKQGLSKELKEKLEQKKAQIKEKNQEIRANQVEWVKEKSDKIKEQYEAKKQELEQLKEKQSACGSKDKKNTTDCQDKKLELKKGVKQHLLKTIDLIDDSYLRMTQKISASTGLTAEQKQTLLNQVATLEQTLIDQKAKVEALADNATNAEFKDTIKELKNVWQDTRKMQHRLMASLINARMENIVEKHDEFYITLTAKIEQLKQKGVDTLELEALAEKFKQQTEQLKADQTAATDAWIAAIDKDKLDAAKELTDKVKEDLKQTRETLREFLEKFKELNKEAKSKPVEAATETTTASA